MGSLVHTGLCSSSLVPHVLHSPPPPMRTALSRSFSRAGQFHLKFGVSRRSGQRNGGLQAGGSGEHVDIGIGAAIHYHQKKNRTALRSRLVVSHSTCPPLSSSPHVNSFVIGPAVIKHTHFFWTLLLSNQSTQWLVVSRSTCPPIFPPPTQTARSCSNKHTHRGTRENRLHPALKYRVPHGSPSSLVRDGQKLFKGWTVSFEV
jgi:hypothetical protein